MTPAVTAADSRRLEYKPGLRLQATRQLYALCIQHILIHSTKMLFSIGINHNGNGSTISKHFYDKRSEIIMNNIQW